MDNYLGSYVITFKDGVFLRGLEWGYSSAGRANGSQSLGRRFDPAYLHQLEKAVFYQKNAAFYFLYRILAIRRRLF